MPPPGRDMWSLSDSRRDAERYHRLLLALERATDEVKVMEDRGRPDMDEVLGHLLPDLTTALNARQAFVATAREAPHGKYLEITAAHPAADLRGRLLPWREFFADLIEDGRPRVIDPLGEETPNLISGLELFSATEAILVRAHRVSLAAASSASATNATPEPAPTSPPMAGCSTTSSSWSPSVRAWASATRRSSKASTAPPRPSVRSMSLTACCR